MDWKDTPAQAQWRADVRSFLKTELPEEIRGKGGLFEKPDHSAPWEEWRTALSSRGWIAPAWPKAYGGADMTAVDQFILNEEMAEAQAPSVGGLGVMMLGPTLIAHGTEEQKKQHLGAILRGESVWCQGYSEPGSGSDLASLQTRAVRDGDDFVVNGQKIWTSLAHAADWCFCLTRTDPEAPKHRGITYLLIDMHTPGITVRPLVNMAGQHHFNEVFFEDVRVPVRNVVGEINRGWYVGTTTLDFERSSIGASVGARQQIDSYVSWMRNHRSEVAPADYAAARIMWADRSIEVAIARQLGLRVISMQAAGQIPNSEASIAKLYGSELSHRIARTAARMIGMWAGVIDERSPFGGSAALAVSEVIPQTIAGGTSEIQRNIIATRGLGLPRG